MINIQHASAQKSGNRIFSDLSLTIEDGDNILVAGANGSGKTTLLEIIAGVLPVSQGDVIYDFVTGTTWEERYQQRKQFLHFVPADAALTRVNQPDLFYQQRYYSLGDTFVPTVNDFLGDELIERIHAFGFPASLSIDHLLALKLTRLSNGQQKRLVILENLAKQIPKVLLLDHPFEALDRKSRYELTHFLEVLSMGHNVQLIISDHESQLPSVLNRTVLLKDCRVHEQFRFKPQLGSPSPDAKTRNDSRAVEHPVVEMRDVTIRYGDTTIIDELSWTINKGERWALAGKNGSGKTTLFSLIYADHPLAYSEQVFLFGKRRGSGESIWDIKNRISYVGPEQMTFLDPVDRLMKGRTYILKSDKHADVTRLDSLVGMFDAQTFIDKPIRQMSSGEIQLLFIIKSLLQPKELLLLDEPFRFLDAEKKKLLNEYLQLHLDRDTTLVLITHDEHDMQRWGSQVLWL